MSNEQKLFEINQWFNSAKTIQSQLPVQLENGATVTRLAVKCYRCRTEIEQLQMRGTLTLSVGVYTMTGYGYCAECNLLTPFNYRIRPDDHGGFQINPMEKRNAFDDKGDILEFKRRN